MADTVGPDEPAPAARRRLATAGVVALVLVALVASARSADRATVREVLEIPELATVRADRLTNGTPVFVVSTPDIGAGGTPALDVVQAFATELQGPVTELVGWCAAAGTFVAPHHGPVYDVRGRRLPTTLNGRARVDDRGLLTALDDLIHRVATPIEGRTAPADPITVEGVQPLQPWQVAERPNLRPVTPPGQCRRPENPPIAPAEEPQDPEIVDHSFMAGDVDPGRGGWQITDGWLVVDTTGRGRWCDEEPGPLPSATCGAPRDDVPVGFTVDDVGEVPAVLGGPLAVRFAEGAVARVAVLPDSSWRGSSLRGTEVFTGEVVRSWSARDQTLGVRALDGGGPCLSTYPGGRTDGVTITRVPVTAHTAIELDDAFTAGEEVLEVDRPTPVEVVVDAATCEALVVRRP